MPKAQLFHNPRCSKSRQALAFLQEQTDIELDIIEYLKMPISKDQIASLFEALQLPHAHQMIRPKEAEYAMAGLNKNSSNEDIITAIVDYPKLLERPIYLIDGKAAIGRPLENIEALIL